LIDSGISAELKHYYTERMILLRSKILLDTDLKIILLNHQNNFVGTLKIISKKFWYSSN